jgi:hypothetical protein
MKRLIIVIAFNLLAGISLFPQQGCLPEGITFTTQEQIDNFQANYPGCTEIEGNVLIGSENGNNSIMNLEGLSTIVTIDGYLDINSCYALGDLSGLNALTQVGDYLKVHHCAELDNFNGLNSLAHVGGTLVISLNDMLTGITALESLTAVDSDLMIANNTSLGSLDGLGNLNFLTGSVRIMSNINLDDISALGNFDPELIETYIAVINNGDLSDCAIQSICSYLEDPDAIAFFSSNAPGCNSPEEVILACQTAIDENKTDELAIFPNPATSFVTLTTPQGEPALEAVIYNHLGQKVVFTKPVNNTVDVSGLKAGMYLMEVSTKDRKERIKFVKNGIQ